jgi:hypothetical protein
MKTNTFLTGTGAVLALALGGCGSVSGIPIEKTATDFAKAICPKAYDCCTTETRMPNMSAGTTEEECETLTAKDFRNSLQNMQASENAGRAKYNQEQVDACLEAIRSASCSELTMIRSLAGLQACDSTFATPLVDIGGTCGQDYECKNSVCQKAPMAWEGVCAVGAAVSASCATDHCAQDLICDGRGTDDATDNICVVAEQENGAACNSAIECKSRICAAAAGATAKTCNAPTGPVCFYGGGCSAAGGAPGIAALLIMTAFVAVALLRSRRTARPRRSSSSR